jgi:uncharacterized protein YqgV (UPF0045/DUF77 family)
MMITVEISLYPLNADYKPVIRAFIHELRTHSGIETVTNQMSTQITGEFDEVMPVVTTGIKKCMEKNGKVVFVTKFLNAGLEILRSPDLE